MIAHRDEVEPERREAGHLRGTWRRLGAAAGTRTLGVNLVHLDEGDWSTPVHVHSHDEEVFYVLGGSGLLWQDGATYRLRVSDCIVHRPRGEAHALRGGDGGLDALVCGQRRDVGLAHLPRAGVSWASPSWVEAGGDHPWLREAQIGPPECPEPRDELPPNVVNAGDATARFGGAVRELAAAAGARATGLNLVTLVPGATGAPAHCHSLEEEVFLILEGEATLSLRPSRGGSPEEHALRPGHVVSRPAGTGVAHAFRAGRAGLTYLAYGSREPNDMTYYPESRTVALRGLGVSFALPG